MFGPSGILVLGPDSSLAAVILAVVLPLSGGDPGRAAVIASAMAIVSGIACVAAGIARLGFVRWVVVAAEPVTSVGVTAADIVAELDDNLCADGIELCFAEVKDPVKDKLKRFGLSRDSAPRRLTPRSAKR